MLVLGQRAERFAVTVIGLVLTDDNEINVLLEVGQRGDVWLVRMFGILEARMQDRAVARQPWVNEDCEGARKSVRVICCGIGW